jgi:threonine/homoserine/homoserine lactone efflux protein
MAAPLLLDAFLMVPLGLVLQDFLTGAEAAKGLGLVGGCLVGWLGLNSIRAARSAITLHPNSEHRASSSSALSSFFKGLVTHLSSPYPYLYWATVGALFIRQGFAREGIFGAVLFPLGFWLGASAFTLLTIFVAAQGRRLVPRRFERWLYSTSGMVLIASGIVLVIRTWYEPPG